MKRALGFIAATVFTTSIYSQPYTGSSAANEALMDRARAQLYSNPAPGVGAPTSTQPGSASGFERSAGASNSSTGQSSGHNISGSIGSSGSGGTSVSQDTDISGLEDPHAVSGKATTGVEGTVQTDSIQPASNLKTTTVDADAGAPSTSQSGGAASTSRFDNPNNSVEIRNHLSSRELQFLNGDSSNMDFYGALNTPDLEGDFIKSLDENADVKVYNGTDYWQQQSVGGPAGSQSGGASSAGEKAEMKKEYDYTDKDRAHKSQTWKDVNSSSEEGLEHSTVRSSGTAVDADERYRINREKGSDQYHVNHEAGAPTSPGASGSSATSESGTRSSGTAVDADERARTEREKRSELSPEKVGTTPSSGTAADSDEKAHPDL